MKFDYRSKKWKALDMDRNSGSTAGELFKRERGSEMLLSLDCRESILDLVRFRAWRLREGIDRSSPNSLMRLWNTSMEVSVAWQGRIKK